MLYFLNNLNLQGSTVIFLCTLYILYVFFHSDVFIVSLFQDGTEYLNKKYSIEFVKIEKQSKIEGSCDIENRIIGINETIEDTQRELFILCHEFAHFYLHQKLTIGQQIYERFEDSKYDFQTGVKRNENPRHWIEWQANSFAAALCLSERALKIHLGRCQRDKGLIVGVIPLNDQVQSQSSFRDLVSMLSSQFNVTKTSIIYRLEDLALIRHYTRMKPIGQIIHEHQPEFFL